MSRAAPIQSSFNGGELSPRLYGRTDQAVYQIGVEEMLGWLPTLQGPAVAAPGTRYVEAAAGPFRLIPFEYNVTQGYAIEASAGRLRFYTNDVRLETAPGVPLEVSTPWTFDNVRTLTWEQSADVLYLFPGSVSPRRLRRTGAASFLFDGLPIVNGPFDPANSNTASTIQVGGGTTGTVTLTANQPIFAEGDVGGLFRIEARDFAGIPAWEPGIGITGTDNIRVSANKVYAAVGGVGRTGTVPPTHAEGLAWDGMGAGQDVNGKGPYGAQWQYLYDRIGVVRITGFTDAYHVTATVERRLADSVVAAPTWRWTFGAFSDRRGWPTCGVIWNERLVLAKKSTLYGSVVGDYENHQAYDSSGNAQRDLAFTATLPNPNVIRWLAADKRLLIGTARAEHVAEQLFGQSDSAGPPVIKIDTSSKKGSAAIKPLQADGLLMVQRAGRKLLELDYALSADGYKPRDMTRLADHIGKAGFVELAWQQEPEGLVWAVRGDGTLASMTYAQDQQVMGWARRALGGGMLARTICTITDPSGERDQLWIGAQVGDAWWVLRAETIWQTGDDPAKAFLVDAGLSYSGTPTASGTGLPHLVGRSCAVLADGKPHPDIVIGAGGSWTIGYPAQDIQIGLPFPARLTTLPIEAGGEDGTSQGKIKRIPVVAVRLLEAQGIQIAVQGGDAQADEHRIASDAMDQAVPLFTGDVTLTTVGSYERYGRITIERFQPTPATLLAIMPTVETSPS